MHGSAKRQCERARWEEGERQRKAAMQCERARPLTCRTKLRSCRSTSRRPAGDPGASPKPWAVDSFRCRLAYFISDSPYKTC
jgi:hypothetical protein